MTEQERDQLLNEAEIMFLRSKDNCKTKNKKIMYGVASAAIHRDRNFLLTKIDKDTDTGICSCGRVTDIIDGPFYCKYCGQRLSAKSGWS
jgi:hypothetical protein